MMNDPAGLFLEAAIEVGENLRNPDPWMNGVRARRNYFFTNAQALWLSGRNAASAGMVSRRVR